ncbi:porin family protein [Flavobacterium sp. B17]|uniref:porin family protein n=1 Tax=Flavobacterium sp. B17 TaxID=95618 RepID=UPI00034C0A1C|nr:porin family protein [Flavobacterium sp. B17]
MKKLILGIALTAGSLAFAQTTTTSSNMSSTSPVRFGIKGGMNVSSLSNDAGLDDSKSKIGFNGGVFANIPVASSFSIQPEVLYNNLGSKVTLTDVNIGGNNYTAEYARHLDYISVPLMFQYNFVPNFYLEAGPEFSFMIDARDKYKNTKNGSTTGAESYSLNKDAFNKFNFGIGIGAGYYFTDNIGLTARYVAGTTDIYKNNNGDAVRNNNFQVGLAFKF